MEKNTLYTALMYQSHGVSEKLKKYNIELKDVIEDEKVYRAIINGYPYKTLEELGVKTKEEGFTATKQAVYTMLYDRNVESYSGLDTEEGRRTYEAYKKIVTSARRKQSKI